MIAGLFALVVLAALSLTIPAVQNFAKNRAINYLKNKTNTEISLEKVHIRFPTGLQLDKFYIEDKKKDTLLYADRLSVQINMLALLKNRIEISDISLQMVKAEIHRLNEDSSFNYQFLIDAFDSGTEVAETQKKYTPASLQWKLGTIAFDDIHLKYKDAISGSDAGLSLGKFYAKVDKFDLEGMHYILNKLEVANTQLHYFRSKAMDTTEQNIGEAKTKLPLIEIEQFLLDNVDLKYKDDPSEMHAFALLKNFSMAHLLIDLSQGKYKTNSAKLNNSIIDFSYRSARAAGTTSTSKKTDSTQAEAPLSLSINDIVLSNNTILYNDLSAPIQKGMMNYNHLNIDGLGISGKNISMDSTGIKATISGGKLREAGGFVLNDLNGKIVYTNEQISIKDFRLKTPHTFIDNHTSISYTNVADLTHHPGRVKMDIVFENSILGLKDASYFVSSISANYHTEKLQLEARINGKMSDIHLEQFRVNGMRNTQININGNIKGLPDVNKTFVDINIGKFFTSKSDLLAVIPKGTLPNSIELPNQIAVNGKFKGSITRFNTQLSMNTDVGWAKANVTMGGTAKLPIYNATIDLNKLNVGYLLKRNDIGTVSLKLNAAGSGTSVQTANTMVKGIIQSAYYNNYNYQNILIDATIARQLLKIKTSSADSNLHFTLNADANLKNTYPSLKGTLDLQRADIQKLRFVDSELKIAGLTAFDFPTTHPDSLNGNASISSLQIAMNGRIINLDSILFNAQSTPTANYLNLKSGIVNVQLSGKYKLTQIGQSFINELNKYYTLGPVVKIAPQLMYFDVRVHESELLKEFVPELTTFSNATLSGMIHTEADSLIINAQLPHIVYGGFDVKNTTLNIGNLADTARLTYSLTNKSIESASLKLYNSVVNGFAANNILDLNAYFRDSKNVDKYGIGGKFSVNDETYKFSLLPEQLLLNYEKWQVANNNFIQYGKAGVYAQNFNISNNGQSLLVNSTYNQPNAPLKISFQNFLLETLTKFAEQDTALVSGTLNGTVDIKNIATTPTFEANLDVSQLRYLKDPLGNVKIIADSYTKDAYKIDVALSDVHDIKATGYYYTKDKGLLDLTLNINRFNLKHIVSLSANQIKEGTGTLSGQLTLNGALTSPQILGALNFKDAALKITQLSSLFKLNNESVSFLNNGIKFDNFTLKDSSNQAFTLNGMIKTSDYTNYGFDLKLRANNFRVLNSTSADNELFYGKVFVTLNANIGGNLNKPEVTGSVKINKNTRFYFEIPDNDPSIVNQDGIIEFVDKDAPPNNGRQALNIDSLTRSPLKGIQLSMDVQTEKEAEVTILVDPANGDALLLKGEADLNTTMDPSGKISVTGRYLISEGTYNLSVGGIAKRKFQLQQGSYMQWTGAPTEANVDLTASYNTNTSALDLISNEVQSSDESSKTMYKQKLPFIVHLKMTNELLKPKIGFEIALPENEKNVFGGIVNAKLTQINANEGELNKQVFALLALNRFISDNPFQSLAGATSPEMLARQSVSRLLTQQLNNLAADLIKGVDVSFDLSSQSDYATGSQQTRTDLNVALSKRLLNDRLTVTVGNNFALEGGGKNTPNNGVNLAGNVSIEYMLSRDGKYRLRAYRRNQSDMVVEGQIIETGLGFVMVVDYNQFKNIFRSLKSEEKLAKEREERRKQQKTKTEQSAQKRQ